MIRPLGLKEVNAEFLLMLDEDAISSFLSDRRIKAAANKTNCVIELTKRILNRKIKELKFVKYSILRVTGPDDVAIKQCNKLIEKIYPPYHHRKEYHRRAPVVIYTDPVIPDNTSLYYSRQRTGRTSSVVGNLKVESPYELGPSANPEEFPWKISKEESAGLYYPTLQLQETTFQFYNLGRIDSEPMHNAQERFFEPERKSITPTCNPDYEAAPIAGYSKEEAFRLLERMPSSESKGVVNRT